MSVSRSGDADIDAAMFGNICWCENYLRIREVTRGLDLAMRKALIPKSQLMPFAS